MHPGDTWIGKACFPKLLSVHKQSHQHRRKIDNRLEDRRRVGGLPADREPWLRRQITVNVLVQPSVSRTCIAGK
jgi:hypothetical protein